MPRFPSKPSVPSAAIEARSASVIMSSFITTDSIDGVRHAPVTYAIGCHDVKLWVLGKIPRERPDWLESAEYIGGRDT
ncbi:hypothetical protein BLIG_01317 [Bifidobacterium longum subsp. infantis CCUG 52486]|uniref:Uncharacterized protein n=1 Tax=Bifidobacterium longum subsp. infantis CCUG 52486 TaxID=537937 RepID=C5EC35_BIFLI|nr:hypothetical protein BLIG_01317 [Bifidobacterium longum subsp. infantis CCUG 52486]